MRTSISQKGTLVLLIATVVGLASLFIAADASAEWNLVYSQDWSEGTGGWSMGQSLLPHKNPPLRIFIGKDLAEYIIYFYGNCGWAIRGSGIPNVPMKLVTRVYMLNSHRNALAVNIRGSSGGLICKYSMGANNHVYSHHQGGDHHRDASSPQGKRKAVQNQ